MAATYTVDQLISRVRLLGDYENSTGDYSDSATHMSSGTLLTFMDVAHRQAWESRSDADEGFNLTRTTYSLVEGSGSYALPTDMHRLRAVELQVGDGWVPLSRATLDDDIWSEETGEPTSYRIIDEHLELLPAPSSGLSLRIGYCPSAEELTSGSQTVSADDGFDVTVVLRTLIMARIREERPYDDFQRQLDEQERRFQEGIRRRDRSTPRRLRDPRALRTDWRRRR